MTAIPRSLIRRPVVRLRRKKLPPLVLRRDPVPAVLLAIDAARTSGYAFYVRGRLLDYGELRAHDTEARRRVCTEALALGLEHELPVGMLLESPFGGSLRTAIGLAQTCALWRDSWLASGGTRSHILELQASQWRQLVFGRALPRTEQRRLEELCAIRVASEHGMPTHGIGGDSAAAICFGHALVRCELLASWRRASSREARS